MVFPDGMHRIAIGIEYNGDAFHGFQRQITATSTVQAYIEKALSKVANEAITVVCAGRTDAGVHASEQVLHFDTLSARQDSAWVRGVNTNLPDDIRVHWAKPVTQHFHARFCATSRIYRYVSIVSKVRPACLGNQVTWLTKAPDLEAMQTAGKYLIGKHNFNAYRAVKCQAPNPIRTVEVLQIYKHGAFIVMQIQANAFLHHMVRNIMGVLFEIGRGAQPPSWAKEVLLTEDRTSAAATAKPDGLYLVKAVYPESFELPKLPLGPLFIGDMN
ncbi:MAG: tRNA pseudouridine(38-40) synthase TruA [Alteromonadaceae bacterium]|nr:MAG: tRNA pseudouridine(38-40) synthase TruA [Alteromonadaceae bacterium]